MNDYKLTYWKEAVSSSFEENYLPLVDSIIENVAKDMIISAEQQSMAFGYDCIPNPAKADKSAEIKRLEDRIKELENDILCYRQSVASRRGVPLEQVHLDNQGSVIYAMY